MDSRKNSDEIEPSARWSMVLGNIAVPLVLVMLINLAFVWKIYKRPLLWHDYVAKYKQQMAAENYNPPLDIIFLGDSTGNQAVQKSVYSALGMRGRNLCTYANVTIAADAWLLDSYLQHNPPPKIVVLVHVFNQPLRDDIAPGMLNRFAVRSSSNFKPDFSTALELESLADKWMPLYFDRTTVLKCYKRPWLFTESFSDYQWDNSGCMNFAETWQDKIKASVDRHANWLKQQPQISQLNTDALTYILQLADIHGFNVVYTQGPHYKALGEKNGFAEFCTSLWNQLEDSTRFCGRQLIVNRELFTAEMDEMGADALHVNVEGAQRYTAYLAKRLRELTDIQSGAEKTNPCPQNATANSPIKEISTPMTSLSSKIKLHHPPENRAQ